MKTNIRNLDDSDADAVGCLRFHKAMLEKLIYKRNYEDKGGWNYLRGCSIKQLETMMREHVDKGDPVDIANFCMMIWNRRNPKG